MGLGSIIGAVGSVVGGISGKKAAKKAAAAQTAMGNRQLDLQERQYDETTARFAPYLGSGGNALRAYNFEMGLGDRPTFGGATPNVESYYETSSPGMFSTGGLAGEFGAGGGINGFLGGMMGLPAGTKINGMDRRTQKWRVNGQSFATREEAEAFAKANATGGTEYAGYQASPGFQWQMDQGTAAIDASAAARGGLMSGRTLQGLQTFGQGLAQQDRETYLSRLAGMTDMGMGAAGAQATAGMNYTQGAGNALANIGNAQAAGAIGQGNALSGMFNNLGQTFGYMNKPGAGGGGINVGQPGSLFGGNNWG